MDSEGKLVASIARAFRSKFGRRDDALLLGIGDDAALIAGPSKYDWALSCDAFLEGVHFVAKSHPPDSVGYKSLIRATSDLAAMGATARFFLLTLAIPQSCTGDWLNDFLRGMARAARSMNMVLLGGDTTKSGTVSIGITVLGEIARGQAVTRAGARPGDTIYVSGRLGRAQLGLEILLRSSVRIKAAAGNIKDGGPELRRLLRPHLYPAIRLDLGFWLAKHRTASAMMDISDGLSTDLARMCLASGVGAQIQSDSIPRVVLPEALSKHFKPLKFDPLKMALHGGEDYELLFTVSPHNIQKLSKAPGFSQLTAIGEVTRDKRISLISLDGSKQPLTSQGWDPFRF
ncbi:MAG TPA: thiamine-phosphate kinase [Candidatus Acidoferrales bacterium]|nr:thiamine-phosphate kinase [Candidatus Acidoferrales bacterium]